MNLQKREAATLILIALVVALFFLSFGLRPNQPNSRVTPPSIKVLQTKYSYQQVIKWSKRFAISPIAKKIKYMSVYVLLNQNIIVIENENFNHELIKTIENQLSQMGLPRDAFIIRQSSPMPRTNTSG